MEHKTLEEYIDGAEWIKKTPHQKITYDVLTEQFIVDIGDNAWCEVWGKGRFFRAVEIADFIWGRK